MSQKLGRVSGMTAKPKIDPHDEMLSGWKDIATHMGKGVRTVQRYERELGLPVRRVSGHPTSAVIATKSDLDSWVRSSATVQESINRSQKAINAAQESRNTAQESRNTAQDSRNLVQDSRNVSQDSRNVSQDSFNKESRRGRTQLYAQVAELRRELRRLRQQVKEIRQRQDVMASAIKDYSKVRASLSARGKH